MGSLHLVTGYAGKEHVTSADQGSFHTALLLNGSYVLNVGNKFAATIVSNNSIKIQDGDILMQGRYIKLDSGTFVEVPIENGAQDYKRNDLIVVRYTKNASTGVESTAFVVIKGTPDTAEAVDPEYTKADILDGALVCDMPLYRVPIDGLNVGALVPLFEVVDSFDERIKALSEGKVDKVEGKGLSANDYSDEEKKKVADHIADTNNPHGVTAADVGLGKVPNVATNDQTPTYTAATEIAALTSGEKLSVAFGKIAKAISSLISHLADSVVHITSAERTAWNNKSDSGHKHTKAEITDFPSTMTPSAHKHTKSEITDFPTSMTPTAHNQAASTITAGTLGGQVVANASAVATLGTKQVRNIYAGTAELTAGTSALPTGDIYIQYE